MTPITCPQCGGLSPYQIRPDGKFECRECSGILYPCDITLDPSWVWCVDETGTLGFVREIREARKDLFRALGEYLDLPLGSSFEAPTLNAIEWAAADLVDAMHAGLRIPEMENTK